MMSEFKFVLCVLNAMLAVIFLMLFFSPISQDVSLTEAEKVRKSAIMFVFMIANIAAIYVPWEK